MTQKASIRRDCLARRDALSQSEKKAKSRTIHERLSTVDEFRAASQLLCHVSKDSEVETQALMENLLKEGRRVLIPVAKRDGTLQWSKLNRLDELEPGAFGVLEPRADSLRLREPAKNALVIVPCVAFDMSGQRLGYGKGFYDRFLAQHGGKTIGLAFETQKVERIPAEAHDVPLDVVVTESQVLVFA